MPEGGNLQEIYRLSKENNQMLRAMRRNARLHGIFKLLFYCAIVGIGLWFYLQFLAPILTQMLDTLDKIQGAGSQAQGQLSTLSSSLEKLREWIPGMASTSNY
jgi:hypothetical protein